MSDLVTYTRSVTCERVPKLDEEARPESLLMLVWVMLDRIIVSVIQRDSDPKMIYAAAECLLAGVIDYLDTFDRYFVSLQNESEKLN